MTGGYDGLYGDANSASTGLTVTGSSFYANAFAGVDLEVSNDHATFTGDTFAGFTGDTYAGSSYGLYLNNVNDATVASSLAEDAGTGIYVYGARDLIGGPNTVDGNTVVSNNTGINVQSSSAVAGDLDTVSYNIVRENYQYGINAGGNVLVSYNNIYNNVNATGILVSDATAFHNQVFANNVGILANSNGAVISDNQVFDNAGIGIHVYWNTLVQGNTVHDNAVGVQGDYLSYPNIPYSGTITNNLIYQNSQDGILLNQAGGAQVLNNTVDQAAGNAVAVDSSSSSVSLENNILWAQSGYDINVTPDSEVGFHSDYNDLYTTATGRIGLWEGQSFAALDDWAYDVGLDYHSTVANPMFIDPPAPTTLWDSVTSPSAQPISSMTAARQASTSRATGRPRQPEDLTASSPRATPREATSPPTPSLA